MVSTDCSLSCQNNTTRGNSRTAGGCWERGRPKEKSYDIVGLQ
jgi:hypothetical protein